MAKTCLLCGAPAADDVATCPNDGEASWSGPIGVIVEEDLAQPTDADEAPKPKTKRSPK